MKNLGIYIHIPFCIKKCSYCDFYSVKTDTALENIYIEMIKKEIDGKKEIFSGYKVDTVFLGGGTPSSIDSGNITKILSHLRKNFDISKEAEISIEINPGTVTEKKLSEYRNEGINRISTGIQTLNDKILKNIGRIHSAEEALTTLIKTKKAGFKNISCDLMFNLPGQDKENIKDTIEKILDFDIKHISWYSLKPEKGTELYRKHKNGEIFLHDDETEREMYYMGREILEMNGIYQYEISNFAQKGYESRHNLKYWQREEYLGLGAAAHSFYKEKRTANAGTINGYIKMIQEKNDAAEEVIDIDEKERIWEYIILGLRKTDGISLNELRKIDNKYKTEHLKTVEKLRIMELMNISQGKTFLTKKGMDISNKVFLEFDNYY